MIDDSYKKFEFIQWKHLLLWCVGMTSRFQGSIAVKKKVNDSKIEMNKSM